MATLAQPRLTWGRIAKSYYELSKPRIVALLIFTTVTTMFIAADGLPPFDLLIFTIIGGAGAAAGASALNQYIDREMDAQMVRTAKRPIPSGRIAPHDALIYGLVVSAVSVLILGVGVNWLTAGLALIGAVYYVYVYTILLKRNTTMNIVIGGGAGAMPVLVGWAAMTGDLSLAAWILFGIVFYWTPPHSWALALIVNDDYARVGVPMMPVAHGEASTHRQIILYSVLLLIISLLPISIGVLGWPYTLAAAVLGLELLRRAVILLRDPNPQTRRNMWKFSTAYLAYLFLAMIIDSLLVL
ncbi:MAG: heme o synthase [Phototrophicaceae bacterium]|jgi:protoheme IX farnesyltransferase